ncbi:MAG: hypothetical protein ACRC7C_02805 [Beijerinckiaceae bacterium]
MATAIATIMAGLFSALLQPLPAVAADAVTGIEWQVRDRFRVVYSDDQAQFMRDFDSYFERAAGNGGPDAADGQWQVYPSPFKPGLRTAYVPAAAQYGRSWFHDRGRKIDVKIARRAERFLTCIWTLGREEAIAPCGREVALRTEVGKHRLSVRIMDDVSPGFFDREIDIEVKDLKFVALGDSFASGEGNPHVTYRVMPGTGGERHRLVEWWEHRCHRSLLAPAGQAAVNLARARRDTSVTYVSYACSGATVDEGILGPYAGRETVEDMKITIEPTDQAQLVYFKGTKLRPQLNQAKDLLCPRQGEAGCLDEPAKPDILALTTGGNELDFGPLVAGCASGSCRIDAATMAPRFRDLDRQFADLALRLPELGAKNIFLVGYPDMTKNENGGFCNDNPFDFRPDFIPRWLTLFGFGVSRLEASNAFREVLDPLRKRMQRIATAQGWTYVERFKVNRGFCARPSWFHTYGQSWNKQHLVAGEIPTGAMHPNVFGHRDAAERLLDEINRKVK